MRQLSALIIIVIALFIPSLADDDGVRATTALDLPVDSVTIYPDGLVSARAIGSLDVTEGTHDFVMNVPDSADMNSVLLRVTNAAIERIAFDDDPTYTLNFTSGGAQTFTLSYLMYGAGYWEPRYDIHIDNDSVYVSAGALVQNRGGEDLEDVRLKLVAGLAPAVEPYLKAGRAAQVDLDYFAAETAEEAVAAAPMAPAPAPSLAPGASGELETLYIFELPGRKDIETDKEIAFPLFEIEAPVRRTYTWDAYTDPEGPALEEIRANNTMQAPWPEGTAMLYRDDEYVSTITMPFTPNGTNASIVVGPSPDMDVERSLLDYNITEEIITLGDGGENHSIKETTEAWTYRLSIESNLDRVAEAEVTDSRPKESRIVDISPEPEEMTATEMKWVLAIDPREKVLVEYTYIIVTTETLDGR